MNDKFKTRKICRVCFLPIVYKKDCHWEESPNRVGKSDDIEPEEGMEMIEAGIKLPRPFFTFLELNLQRVVRALQVGCAVVSFGERLFEAVP